MTATSDGCATSTTHAVRKPPYLIADASKWQGENPDWDILKPHCVGLVLKATQGLNYAPDWFVRHWPKAKEFEIRGAYHYLDFRYDGKKQAQFFLAHVARAGGLDRNDICPIVDVERGGANAGATRAQVEDQVGKYSATIKAEAGRDTILYGRGALRDLGITQKMGCAAAWNPDYERFMTMHGLKPAFTIDDVVAWQYTNGSSGDNSTHGCPIRIPGWQGGLDLSVLIDGNRPVELERAKARLRR